MRVPMTDAGRTAADPESLGVDPAGLQRAADRIQAEVDTGRLPAAQLAVARHGQLILDVSFGSATTADRFVVYSCTKAFTGGVIWQLLGEGRLALDDPAARYVPSFGANGKNAVTIAHLLTHTGGVPHTPPRGPLPGSAAGASPLHQSTRAPRTWRCGAWGVPDPRRPPCLGVWGTGRPRPGR